MRLNFQLSLLHSPLKNICWVCIFEFPYRDRARYFRDRTIGYICWLDFSPNPKFGRRGPDDFTSFNRF